MNKASEHRLHADECRSLAKQMETPEDREQLLRLADAWDRLSAEIDGTPSPLKPLQTPLGPAAPAREDGDPRV